MSVLARREFRRMTISAPMPLRRSQAQRSEDTRKRLLEAAVEVLAERGFGGLSMAMVTKRAGVSSGARTHHYRSKADLVIAATEYAYDRAIEKGEEIAASSEARVDPLAAFLRDSRYIYFGRHFIIACEVLFGVRTDERMMPKIIAVMERYRTVMNGIWLEAFRETGVSRDIAEDVVNLTLFMIRGMAINSIWHNRPGEYEKFIDRWHALVLETYLRTP